MNTANTRATLFLVVGPSGAGKDTLIDGARRAFRDDPRLVFPRRVITRAPDPGSENHLAVDERRFAQMLARGAFALSWRAHGLHYGAPASIWPTLERGQSVVINISRGVIAQARAKFAAAHVLLVTASAGALRARLAARGREGVDEIARRIACATTYPVPAPPLSHIDNSGALEPATSRFNAAIASQLGKA